LETLIKHTTEQNAANATMMVFILVHIFSLSFYSVAVKQIMEDLNSTFLHSSQFSLSLSARWSFCS